jgi:hypothetical protein
VRSQPPTLTGNLNEHPIVFEEKRHSRTCWSWIQLQLYLDKMIKKNQERSEIYTMVLCVPGRMKYKLLCAIFMLLPSANSNDADYMNSIYQNLNEIYGHYHKTQSFMDTSEWKTWTKPKNIGRNQLVCNTHLIHISTHN